MRRGLTSRIFYYLSESEIWLHKRGGFSW